VLSWVENKKTCSGQGQNTPKEKAQKTAPSQLGYVFAFFLGTKLWSQNIY